MYAQISSRMFPDTLMCDLIVSLLAMRCKSLETFENKGAFLQYETI